jgi:hypothetical protein
MDLRTVLSVTVVAIALYSGWHRFELRAVHPADGVLAPEEPRQSAARDTTEVRLGKWRLTPRADYDITARILSRADYRFDALADLIPEDLALGWGPMSDNQLLAHFDIEQSARFYSWRPHGTLPLARETVISHSANTHLIPADERIRSQLARLRVGEVVHLGGQLIDARRDDGAWIRTSLTRADAGAGACEVLLVRSIDVE